MTQEEAAAYAGDLERLLGLFSELVRVDTHGLVPLAHPLEIPVRPRADQITETDVRDALQPLAPQVRQDHYLVPRVIE